MGSPRVLAPLELLSSSLGPSPLSEVLGCLAVRIMVASSSPVRSMTWDGCSGTCVPVNSSMNKRSGQVAGPNCSICLNRWVPYRACPDSVNSPLGVGMSEMSDKLSRVLSARSAGELVQSLESEESLLPEEPVCQHPRRDNRSRSHQTGRSCSWGNRKMKRGITFSELLEHFKRGLQRSVISKVVGNSQQDCANFEDENGKTEAPTPYL
ncbi:hypothetical protein TIFTF001_020401 [Ficus carica]|uniref:Uncharacterized protein n=1 Tax=Ficus carica TaxID=3494 RepID=A0AA88AU02_FICCA|nr:hypothetical protein TIFTF001_020401 [Ficus carica]